MDKNKILVAAQQFTVRGQIQKAVEEWKKLITDTPNDANIYNTIGDLCLKYQVSEQGKGEAISNYVKAAEIFESSGFALKAIAVYKKVLKIAPSRKDIYIKLGNLNCERGLIGNAREDYLVAAKLHTQEGQIREALDVYRKIADLDPSNLNVRLKIADIFMKEGLNSEAIEEYNKVASAHLQAGRKEDAESLYKLILRVEPNDASATLNIGKLRLEDGYCDEAIAYVRKALENSPDSEDAFSLLIDSYNKAKKYDEAEELINKHINDYPDQIGCREKLASILLNRGELQRAAEEYLNLSKEYLSRHNIEKAYGFAEKTIGISPELVSAHEILFEMSLSSGNKDTIEHKGLFLAKYYFDRGDKSKAGYYFKKILEVNPFSAEAKDGLSNIEPVNESEIPAPVVLPETADISNHITSADAYMKYGLVEKAVNELKSALSIDPDNKIAHSRLKDVYKTTGDLEKAIDECLILSEIYESEGDGDRIAELIQEAAVINPSDRRIQEYRDRMTPSAQVDVSELLEEAEFYAQQGMNDEAVNVYEKILHADPDNQEAKAKLLRLKGSQPEIVRPAADAGSKDKAVSSPFFDLGEALKESETEEPVRTFTQEDGPATRSFEELFQEFQEGIRSQLSSEDYETHYNLGIAYKEMGLFQEAIEEFRLCLPGEHRIIDASFMIALCCKEIGQYSEAAEVLKKAAQSPQFNDRNHLVVKYELGALLEMSGKKEDALSVFNEIHDTDATYRDVSEKVMTLQKSL
ncbi:MAG: tetratricopeptide repeat protein [Nitrospirae bacterium]|nr:tetratricopeptide repeat protein [Nitrospirota bacterium]